VILFGSCIHRRNFVIDTVFVVDRWLEHGQADYRDGLDEISDVYRAVTIEPWYSGAGSDSNSYRLYFGARPDSPVDGMFSFFPASTLQRHPHGFPRPRIHLDVITPNLTQGKRMNPQSSVADVKTLWGDVVDQVERAGLLLGVQAELPSSRPQ
jgi:hypothetical protein